ncbi:DUF6538 domain-containing protein [Ensifer sp. SL37]|uniref:DUF6538 domain-containing protein n=1 Tax=Ensifer sp. SL37 TaxID=2995137 RepID=UPI00227434A1|nr:DUF6538 domain-containing protein [Ensifer sp. SL37]MCY1740393.1 hypothetical protein [Ensifer sp. SL37]
MKAKTKIRHTVIRDGIYYFRIAVPKHLWEKYRDPKTGKKRTQIWETLNTSDPDEALLKVGPLLQKWRRHFATETVPGDDISYPALQQTSEGFAAPFAYQWSGNFLTASVQDAISMYSERYEAAASLNNNPNTRQVAALVGAVEPPALTFMQAFAEFKRVSPEKVKGKTPLDTKRFWRRYEQYVEDFIADMGDRDVLKLTRSDVKEYRRKLKQRVIDNEYKSDNANKKLGWLRNILQVVFDEMYEGKENPFDNIKITGFDDDAVRPPFTLGEILTIRTALEKSGMRAEAKAIIRIGECTGANARELALMQACDIHLDAPVPYISIRPNGLRHKVKGGGKRHRDVPLVGDAFDAMRQFPQGFTVYHTEDGPDQINSAMSDFFKKTIPGKGFGSYRHTVQDWLRNSGCNDTMKDSIVGHKTKGHSMYYGAGYELENKKEAIENALEYGRRKIAEFVQHNQKQQHDMTEAKAA